MSTPGSWQLRAFLASANAMSTNAVIDALDSGPCRPPCTQNHKIMHILDRYYRKIASDAFLYFFLLSHRHAGGVDGIVLFKGSIWLLFVLYQIQQRPTQMLLTDTNIRVCHGENFYYIRSDPERKTVSRYDPRNAQYEAGIGSVLI